jgi:3-oxoacyl-[acyl-carrier protein] reductase
VALVTGASRLRGIAAAVAVGLAESGWDVATTYLQRYDERMPWGSDTGDLELLEAQNRLHRAATLAVEADLTDPKSASPDLRRRRVGSDRGDRPDSRPLRIGRFWHPGHNAR